MDTFTRAYVECIEFTDMHGDNEMIGDATEFSPSLLAAIEADCDDFQDANAELLDAYQEAGQTIEQAGHDFWLTRNGHGAGFWDRALPGDLGRRLTAASKSYGGVDLYAGDDGLIYGWS